MPWWYDRRSHADTGGLDPSDRRRFLIAQAIAEESRVTGRADAVDSEAELRLTPAPGLCERPIDASDKRLTAVGAGR